MRSIFTTILCLLYLMGSAQADAEVHEVISTDSLEQIIQSSVHDTSKMKSLIKWAKANRYSSEPKLPDYINQWIEYAKKSVDTTEEFAGNLFLGTHFYLRGEYDLAIKSYYTSLGLAELMKNDKMRASSHMGIGIVQYYSENFTEAEKTYTRSIELFSTNNDSLGIIGCWIWLGLIYGNTNNLPKALEFQKKALLVAQRNNFQAEISNTINNIGELYLAKNELDSARNYIQMSMDLDEKLQDTYNLSIGHLTLGDIDIEATNYGAAIERFQAGLELADLHEYQILRSKANEKLSTVFSLKGDHELALNHYKEYAAIKDSIFNEGKSKEIGKLEAKYEFEKIEEEKRRVEEQKRRISAEAEQRRNNLQYSGILIFLVLLGAGILALGKMAIPERLAEGLIFFSFLLFFEFMLVLLDPYIERFSGGEPAYKLLFNAVLAGMIFPLHSFLEAIFKHRLAK